MLDAGQRTGQKHSLLTNIIIVWAGGYLDGFTFIGHGHVFANAMTANVVLLGVDLIAFPTQPFMHHLLPIIVFAFGVWAARGFQHEVSKNRIRQPDRVVLLIEIGVILVLAILPNSTPSIAITLPIVFVASLQLRTFSTVHSHSYSSTFTTGNLVSLSEALFDWSFNNRTNEAAQKCRIFFCICTAFLVGAAFGCYGVRHVGNRSLLVDVVALAIALPRVTSDATTA